MLNSFGFYSHYITTLKDLGFNLTVNDKWCNGCTGCDEGTSCDIVRIKAEAVKHGIMLKEAGELRTLSWVKQFFNITEEDLK